MPTNIELNWGISNNIDIATEAQEAIDYIETPDELRVLSKKLSKMIKSVDRPNIKLKTFTLNQYNRKRIIYNNEEFKNNI